MYDVLSSKKKKIKKTSFIKILPLEKVIIFVRHYSKWFQFEPAIFTAANLLVTSYSTLFAEGNTTDT